MAFLEWKLYGITVYTWLQALTITIGTYLIFWIAEKILANRFDALAKRDIRFNWSIIARMLEKTSHLLIFVLALYVGSQVLLPQDSVAKSWANVVAIFAGLIQAGIWGNTFISEWLKRFQEKHLETDAARVTTMRAIGFIARVALYSIILIVALDSIPTVDVTALIASLGIGGIAVALALQNVLSDLFASLSISLDKPFVIGDFVIVGDFLGTIESIGLKTTRIRSLSGEQLIFSNNDLLNSRIRNYKRMQERRVVFHIGVIYQTSYDKVEKIPGIIRSIIEELEQTRFDRSHFKEYGNFSLNFETVYYVLTPDYNIYMDIQQAINFAIYRRFEEEGIVFAYPTQTIYLEGKEQNTGMQSSIA